MLSRDNRGSFGARKMSAAVPAELVCVLELSLQLCACRVGPCLRRPVQDRDFVVRERSRVLAVVLSSDWACVHVQARIR